MSKLALLPLMPWTVWACGALLYGGRGPDLTRVLLLGVAVAVVAAGSWRFEARGLLGALLLVNVLISAFFFGLRPSNNRNWTEDQSRLPRATLDGDTLTIQNLRAFRYTSPTTWRANWKTQSYDLRTLEGVDFAVERFTRHEAVAHTLVSFRFTDAEPLAMSIEIRKEKGESFSALKGLFRQYERMIVMGDERDLLELRAVHRKDTVYLHPMRTQPEFPRKFLEHIVAEAQQLEHQPAFYNTLTASCATGLADHLRAVADVPWNWRMHVPGYSDQLAFEWGMIETELDFERTRDRHRINAMAEKAAGQPDFSTRIRASP